MSVGSGPRELGGLQQGGYTAYADDQAFGPRTSAWQLKQRERRELLKAFYIKPNCLGSVKSDSVRMMTCVLILHDTVTLRAQNKL